MQPSDNPPPYSATPVTGQPQTVMHAHIVGPGMASVVPVVVGRQMASHPCSLKCPSCQEDITTRVKKRTTMRTHLFAALLCVFACWPCVFIPYCMDSCMNADHFCPICNSYIGSYMN